MKKFLIGFITGGILCATVTGIAVEYAITTNPYPVKVNGTETAIEGYNINDNTYFKLRDVSAAVGGFDVGFVDNTITIDTATASPVPTEAPTASVDVSEPLSEVEIETIDGVQYVRKSAVEKMLESIGLGDYKFSASYFYNQNDLANPILENMPNAPDTTIYIPYDYYISTVIPTINSLR